ncbi:MAG: nitrilase-related carbon-nitrogen hydrolase, partial [Nitriliruptoraceae bacterium]
MPLEVAVIQHDIAWEDHATTLSRLSGMLDRAAASGAELAVLPEMFATGWSMQTERTAQREDGPIVSWMKERAAALDLVIAGSVATNVDGALPANRMLVVDADGVVERYDKIHLVTVFAEHTVGESQRFGGGDMTVVTQIGGVRFGLTICYDLRFGDLFWDMAEHVDAYIVIANWPAVRQHHWTNLLRTRAIENQAYVIAANRIGQGGGLDFAGDSCVIDPMGEILANAEGIETTISAKVDEEIVAGIRSTFPFLADR